MEPGSGAWRLTPTLSHDHKMRPLPRINWTKRSLLLAYAILFRELCFGVSASFG
jgi:hypothetical protein